tara:strand:+ start:160 stop:405 length:246 start_codon:yes stop_codon:yes gene_type:complete
MAQLGSEEKPFVMSTGTIVSTKSRHRRGFNKSAYDKNYDRIFKKDPLFNRPKTDFKKDPLFYRNEFEAARAKSKTFSMEQD